MLGSTPPRLRIQEEDGSPSVVPTTLKVPNGSLTDNGDGSVSLADPVPSTITVADTTDATSFVALFESASGNLGPKTDAGIIYDANAAQLSLGAGGLLSDTIGEKTGAAGVTIDGVLLKDSKILHTYINNLYMFRATQSGATTLTDNVATKVLFGTEVYDYNGNFASSTYTAPVAGVYHFDTQVTLSTTTSGVAGSFIVSLYINTVETYRSSQGTPVTSLGMLLSCDILLAANDTVEVYCLQNSNGDVSTVTTNARTFFNGHLLRAT